MGVVTLKVHTTPTRLLVANPKRINFMIINNSTTNVFVGFDNTVETSGYKKGVQISANGGFWSYEYHKGEVWAIASEETEVTVVESSEGE